MKGNDHEEKLADKAIITSGLCLRKCVLRSLRNNLLVQSQGFHTIDHLQKKVWTAE